MAFGWQGVFVALAAVSALAALGAGYLYFLGAKAAASRQASAVNERRRGEAPLVDCPTVLSIEWADGTLSEFASLWLRDNLREDRDPHSGQRLVDIADLPENPQIRSAAAHNGAVYIEWEAEPRTASFELRMAACTCIESLLRPAGTSRPSAGWRAPRLDAARDFAWATFSSGPERPVAARAVARRGCCKTASRS